MKDKIEALQKDLQQQIEGAVNLEQVEELRVRLLGKKGPMQALMVDLKDVPKEDKPAMGKRLNELKQAIQQAIQNKQDLFAAQQLEKKLSQEKIDVTLPGKKQVFSREHPIHKFMQEIIDVFVSMGFAVQEGPEVESDFYNFEGLNFPPDHPARDMQDTFYVTDEILLRTHTSNVQVRHMESHTPPFRIIAPGKVYRNEDVNVRSHVLFHQVDGFYVDKGVSMSDLLATLKTFFIKLFGSDVKARFRPSYFPFVEPGIEADVTCMICAAKGCKICKGTGWLEVLGAGMIHPNVLKNTGIDPEEYSGFAWGLGVERILMIMRGITDIRLFWENDLRFLEQFS